MTICAQAAGSRRSDVRTAKACPGRGEEQPRGIARGASRKRGNRGGGSQELPGVDFLITQQTGSWPDRSSIKQPAI